jgi:hypothetical protein
MRGGFERNKLLGGPFNLLENEKNVFICRQILDIGI